MPIVENRFLKTILDASPGLIAYWGRDMRCRYANHAYVDWFGMAPEAIIGMHMSELLGERLFKLNEPFIYGALAGKQQWFERTLSKADGSIGYTVANYVPDVDETDQVAGFSVLVSDVTSLKLAEFQTEKAQARLRAVLDSVVDGIITFDAGLAILSINPAGLHMFGYAADQLPGRSLRLLIPGQQDGDDPSKLPQVQTLTGLRADGHRFPLELRIAPVDTPGESLFVGVVRDITLQQQIHDQLTLLAMQDGLTGLANRRHFDDVLAREFNSHARTGFELSLLLIDVDLFKQFNDRYGHFAGDECLRQVARAIGRAVTRTTDLAARYGGEEFACILAMTDQAGAVLIARNIQQEVRALAIAHEASTVAPYVTVSIGIATARCTSAISTESIIKLADVQLYAAKLNGRDQFLAAELEPAVGQPY